MPRRLPCSLLAALLLAFHAVVGAAAWEISNRVVIEHGTLVIDHSKSVSEITLAQAKGGFPAKHGLGLFQNRVKTELGIEQSDPKQQRLTMTTRIQTAPIIYIAREYAEGSCAYSTILGHEQLHQLFDLEVLRAMPDEIRSITQLVFPADELGWTPVPDLERARKRFFQQYKYVYDARSFPRHQRIDNPESYQRLSALCNGEIARGLAGN
ncbi:MAG: hypothetical protein PHD37_13835 [Gallionellaceae bacterium]|nr:hypothetical protein [Gallionellaceae bacterium]